MRNLSREQGNAEKSGNRDPLDYQAEKYAYKTPGNKGIYLRGTCYPPIPPSLVRKIGTWLMVSKSS